MDEEAKRGPGRPPKTVVETVAPEPERMAMRVLRDYWVTEDERVRAGSIVHCTAMEAIDGLERGTMERVRG